MAPASPAAVALRPLSTGELIDRGFVLYRNHFAGLFLLALLAQGGQLVLKVCISVFHLLPANDLVMKHPAQFFLKLGMMMAIGTVVQVIQFCFAIIISLYVADIYLGRVPSVLGSFRLFAGKALGATWTWLITRFFYLLTLFFPILAEIVLIVWYTLAPPRGFVFFALYLFVAVILVVASLIPLLIVAMRLMLTAPVMALETRSGWNACKRSSALVAFDPGLGFFFWGETRLSLLLLPLFVIQIMVSSLTSLPVIVAQVHEFIRHGNTTAVAYSSDWVIIGSQILTYLASALILPLYSIAIVLFYYDVRIRREGFDLEFMAGRLEQIA